MGMAAVDFAGWARACAVAELLVFKFWTVAKRQMHKRGIFVKNRNKFTGGSLECNSSQVCL